MKKFLIFFNTQIGMLQNAHSENLCNSDKNLTNIFCIVKTFAIEF